MCHGQHVVVIISFHTGGGEVIMTLGYVKAESCDVQPLKLVKQLLGLWIVDTD